MAQVLTFNPVWKDSPVEVRTVKNLGWLLKHWKDVQCFECIAVWDNPVGPAPADTILVAHLGNGKVYITNWASYHLMRAWLHRPVFRTLPIGIVSSGLKFWGEC